MKKFLAILLKILLPILLILVTMSFIIENIAVKTISNDIVTKRIEGYMLDEIINKVDDDTLIEMIKLVQDGNSMRSVSLQYGCGEEFMGKVMRKESRAYIWDKI